MKSKNDINQQGLLSVVFRMCSSGMSFLCLISALLTYTSCRKDLCYIHDQHAPKVRINLIPEWELTWERMYDYDWESLWEESWRYEYKDFAPDAASGIRSIAYHESGSISENNHHQSGGELSMSLGINDLLFYNNDTEYILFNDLSAHSTARATTRGVTRTGMRELHDGERTVNPPDQLFGCFVEGYTAERTVESVDLNVVMRPLTYTYLIRYEFAKGLNYVALARGALAGMAESVYLNDGHTGNTSATILYDCFLSDGVIEAAVRSFGVPNYPGDHYTRGDGTSASFALNLEVLLNNGKYKNFEFDVTDQVLGQPRGGIIIVHDIEISDEEGTAGSGGFDVNVEGWGDRVDIPLPVY